MAGHFNILRLLVKPPVNDSSNRIMDPLKPDERIIKDAIGLLSLLISPPAGENRTSREKFKEPDYVLRTKLSSLIKSAILERFIKIDHIEKTWNDWRIHTAWDFVRICLLLMKIIRNAVSRTEDEKIKLLSIAEKKILEEAFQFILTLAVLPYLLPGIGTPLEKKCLHFKDMKPEHLDNLTMYKRLSFTMDALLDLRSTKVFHEIIISKHLDVIFAVLMQLSFAPYRKPVSRDLSSDSVADNCDFGQMSFSMWNRVERYRKKYRCELEKLQTQLSRPLVIRNFFILLSSEGLPRWMYIKLTTMMNAQILKENGVIAAIMGILDVDNDSLFFSSHCMTVSKLISNIFCRQTESEMKLLALQLEKILSENKTASHDSVCVNVVVSAVAEMFKKDQKRTQENLLNAILNPLRDITSYNEEEIGKTIIQLYNLCVTQWNKASVLPISVIEPVTLVLCFIYAHIQNSCCYLKTPVKELLLRFLQEADEDGLLKLLDRAVFHEQMTHEIVPIPVDRRIVLLPDGGMTVVEGEAKILEMEYSIVLLQLIRICNRIQMQNVIGGVISDDWLFQSKNRIKRMIQSACEGAFENAYEPLLPGRVHNLTEITHLVKQGDKETLAKKEEIFLLFKANMKYEGSFLYHCAIEGLACLALFMPDEIIPLLCEEFLGFSKSLPVETRVRIGEILMQIIRSMNNFIVTHKNLLINTFVSAAKDRDNEIRATSLSNLNELCVILRWNIGDVLYEVIECAEQALHDPWEEARRAGILLNGSMFRGFTKKGTFEVRLFESYEELKHIRLNEEDEEMRTQSQLAMDSWREMVEKPMLEKKKIIF